ncbi:hypothetical protein Q1695_013145 [Nippostrongylus brasiliensis]|nr:hypothetical protein Q1695_013145 [Nippostrongylus brasiliensis]
MVTGGGGGGGAPPQLPLSLALIALDRDRPALHKKGLKEKKLSLDRELRESHRPNVRDSPGTLGPFFLYGKIIENTAGDSCEREIDALDPLRPSSNELSGAKLLLRRAVKELSPDVQPTVPGQVVRNHKVVKTIHEPKRGRSSEPRLGTATSQHTFVIETERRRPLLLPVGLTDGAAEYKKAQEALRRARELEEKRQQREQAEREAAEARERERQRTYRPHVAARKSASLKKEIASSGESLPGRDTNSNKRSPVRKKLLSVSNDVISTIVTEPSVVEESFQARLEEYEEDSEVCDEELNEQHFSQLDYKSIFGARPKVARTPDGITNRGGFFRRDPF